MSAQDDGDSGFDPFSDDEEEVRCDECDSELDFELGTCTNELCSNYDADGGPSDEVLRQHERKQMGIDS